MTDLVNREDVIKEIRTYWSEKLDEIPTAVYDGYEVYADQKKCNEILSHNKALANRVKQVPTVEAKPLKFAVWVGIDDFPHEDWECNSCGFVMEADENLPKIYHYCPNCGAMMCAEEGEEE